MQSDYVLPAVIGELVAIEEEYREFYGLSALGFYIEVDQTRYAITPADVLPFAWTGGDGIHFGFLTDFGRLADLMNAPIVCVSPSNDPPLKIVAPDLMSFLGIVCRIKHAESLDGLNFSMAEEEWIENIEEVWLDEELMNVANSLRAAFTERLGVVEPTSIYDTIRSCRAARAEMMCMDTLDGLGIVWDGEDGGAGRSYDFNREGAKDIVALRAFAEEATYVEKLALCRDAQYSCVFAKDYDHDIQLFIAEILYAMGLTLEARNVREM